MDGAGKSNLAKGAIVRKKEGDKPTIVRRVGPCNYPRPSPDTRILTTRPRLTEKCSFGVACCRFNGNKPEILLVKRRYTYAFHAFVYGMYSPENQSSLMNLLNKMTVDEKVILKKIDFMAAWSHIWIAKYDVSRYERLEAKFKRNFPNGGLKLKDAIARSEDGAQLVWEIPKGQRKQRDQKESDIHAAIREFYEETGIEKRQYTIFPLATRTNNFIDDNIRYVQKYFFAYTDQVINPQVRLITNAQVEEISGIKWMPIEEIRVVDQDGRLECSIRPIFNFMKKKIIRI